MSILRPTFVGLLMLITGSAAALAQDEHSVKVIDQAPESDDLSQDLAAKFGEQGYQVTRGSSRTVCELWLRPELPIKAGFQPNPTVLYPLTPGQLVGLLHYPRRGSDFRDQSISSGWYTLRYFQQPVDGNHIGTSPTRDFLLLISAEQDSADKDWSPEDLQSASAAAAGSSHPAMLCLQPAQDGEAPSMRHSEGQDWWILHLQTQGVAEGQPKSEVPLDIVVVGHAAE